MVVMCYDRNDFRVFFFLNSNRNNFGEDGSQNPSCVQELPLHLMLEKRQHVHLSHKELVSAWSEEREQRERGENTSDFGVQGN